MSLVQPVCLPELGHNVTSVLDGSEDGLTDIADARSEGLTGRPVDVSQPFDVQAEGLDSHETGEVEFLGGEDAFGDGFDIGSVLGLS